jgi:hypothetical protein
MMSSKDCYSHKPGDSLSTLNLDEAYNRVMQLMVVSKIRKIRL